jgi:hypothetical protein
LASTTTRQKSIDFDHEIMENEKSSDFDHEIMNLVEKNVRTPAILGRTLESLHKKQNMTLY